MVIGWMCRIRAAGVSMRSGSAAAARKTLLLRHVRPMHLSAVYSSSSSSSPPSPGLTASFSPDRRLVRFGDEPPLAVDAHTNVTPNMLSLVGRGLFQQRGHPICRVKENIKNYMYQRYKTNRGHPVFSVHELTHPVVSVEQCFDRLLVPPDHVSRQRSDSYYVNQTHLLRPHTTSHQSDLISMGLDNFLIVGDCYRRDEIDSSHYPCFHQIDAVRLFDRKKLTQLYQQRPTDQPRANDEHFAMFKDGERSKLTQEFHSLATAALVETDLKECLEGMAKSLFGKEAETRWVPAYFPFTHPSWELEVFWNDNWLEVLGCGIIEQEILFHAGIQDKVGWAWGCGLERLAMAKYQIPDIRLMWTKDQGFHAQFEDLDKDDIVYKAVSKYPACPNDISFFLPADQTDETYSSNDFYDLVRGVGGDLIERVEQTDHFLHPKKNLHSFTYRVFYRSMERTLTQEEANQLHGQIEKEAEEKMGVEIRRNSGGPKAKKKDKEKK